jgi:hypothetical protein
MRTLMILAAALAVAGSAQAQTKKELVQKVLQLQQAAIEGLARRLTEQPAAMLMQEAGVALQRVPSDKREATAKDIQADVKKYVDETVPLVQQRAVKLAPETIGAILEQNLSEDELKQVIGYLESPVQRKFQQLTGDMERSLTEKLVAETRPQVSANISALEASVGKRLGIAPPGAAASAPAAKPPAKAPAKK